MDKNIIILVPCLGIGGQERQAILLAEQLCNVSNCRIVVFFEANPSYSTSVDVLNLNLPPFQSKFGKVIQQLRRSVKLSILRKRDHIDQVISFGDTANLTNILSRGCGESVVSLRISWATEYSFVRKYMYQKSDRIICQTEAMKEMLFQNYKNLQEKTSVFYNIFDVQEIEKKACEPCELQQDKHFKIISVGRLDKQKGYSHLLKAFSYLVSVYEDAELIIAGSGEERGHLEQLAAELNVMDNVLFTGNVLNPYKYMKNADIFVSSACAEGFPNVLVEAMACGLPVIATDCETGPREILSTVAKKANIATDIEYSDYGILIPAFRGDDIDEERKDMILAKAMQDLYEDFTQRSHYAQVCRERVTQFSVSNASRNIQDIFLKNGSRKEGNYFGK